MLKLTARLLGILIAVFAILSSFFDGRLLRLTNADPAMDLFRIIVAAALLFVGFVTMRYAWVRLVMIFVGVLYLLFGLMGFLNRNSFDVVLPSGVTDFDLVYHLVVGALTLLVGVLPTLPKKSDRDEGAVSELRAIAHSAPAR